jgi:hypothetical protein
MARVPFNHLPEELQLYIFQLLDSAPPSEQKNRHEPSLSLTTSTGQLNLKNISLVSHQWRRIVLPVLFRHARLHLNPLPRPKWENCPACLAYASKHWATSLNQTSPQSDIASYHRSQPASDSLLDVVTSDAWNNNERLGTFNALTWESRFFHRSNDFTQFVRRHDLVIDSLVLSIGKLLLPRRDLYRVPAAADRFKASAVLWQRILSAVDPGRIVILAPPAELSYLTNVAVDLSSEWAFSDMDFHILELATSSPLDAPDSRRRSSCGLSPLGRRMTEEEFQLDNLCYVPPGGNTIAQASIMRLRPWTHLGLNEGSFLRAYGTYEYFERGPPSIIYSIKNCLASAAAAAEHSDAREQQQQQQPSNHDQDQTPNPGPSNPAALNLHPLHAIRSFSYTAILPFATHLDFTGILPQLTSLDVQLAPHPTSNILDDKSRVGRAELEDCREEFFAGYRWLTSVFATYAVAAPPPPTQQQQAVPTPSAGRDSSSGAGPSVPLPLLKTFICRDKEHTRNESFREGLDELFIPLCKSSPICEASPRISGVQRQRKVSEIDNLSDLIRVRIPADGSVRYRSPRVG